MTSRSQSLRATKFFRRAGDVARVADRELQFLFALARRQAPVHRDALGDMPWPELDGAAARNALKVCVYRVRQRLGRENAVVTSDRGYRLGDGHSGRLVASRRDRFRAARADVAGRARLAHELADVGRTLAAGLPAFMSDWAAVRTDGTPDRRIAVGGGGTSGDERDRERRYR